MRLLRLLCMMVGVAGAVRSAAGSAERGAYATGEYRDLFRELLGKSEDDVDAKIQASWRQLFCGDPLTQRIFYPIPGDMAYVPDIGNRDVRTEGLSYGMMIAVQLNHQAEFDQLWKFARHFMYHESGPMRGYFTWHTAYDGSMVRADGSAIKGGGPAPDGEEWFTTALFFASHRWGNRAGILNYEAEAQGILHSMLHKDDEADRESETSMFDAKARQIRFVPQGQGSGFTDPSYHLPAFYELWARWARSPEDRSMMTEVARTSREFFKRVANPGTGIMPNFSSFGGEPIGWHGPPEFREDAWRTLSNVALDYSWWAADPWAIGQSNRILTFFAAQPPGNWGDHFTLDGTPTRSGEDSPGLHAMAATAGLAADAGVARPFVQHLWDMPVPDDGRRNHDGLRREGEPRSWRYYDGLLTMLALLEVSGHFRIYDVPGSH